MTLQNCDLYTIVQHFLALWVRTRFKDEKKWWRRRVKSIAKALFQRFDYILNATHRKSATRLLSAFDRQEHKDG